MPTGGTEVVPDTEAAIAVVADHKPVMAFGLGLRDPLGLLFLVKVHARAVHIQRILQAQVGRNDVRSGRGGAPCDAEFSSQRVDCLRAAHVVIERVFCVLRDLVGVGLAPARIVNFKPEISPPGAITQPLGKGFKLGIGHATKRSTNAVCVRRCRSAGIDA